MTCPFGHTLPFGCLSRLRKGMRRSKIWMNTTSPSGRLVEPELEHVDVALGRDRLGRHLDAVVGYEGAGHEEVVVAPAVLAIGLGDLPLAHLLAVDVDVADLLAEDGVEPLDDDQVLAGLEVVDVPLRLAADVSDARVGDRLLVGIGEGLAALPHVLLTLDAELVRLLRLVVDELQVIDADEVGAVDVELLGEVLAADDDVLPGGLLALDVLLGAGSELLLHHG